MVPQQMPNGPFLRSFAYRSSDPGAIPLALTQGFNVVAIVDVSEAPSYPGCVIMSSLLPHPSLVSMILSTDRSDPNCQKIEWTYKSEYYRFIGSPERESVMANIAGSLYKTTHPILFYAEIDVDRQFAVFEVLCSFLAKELGVIVGDFEALFNGQDNAGFDDNPKNRAVILDLLFMNGYIDKEVYSLSFPETMLPSPRAINVILSDYNYAFPTMEDSVKAACSIIGAYKYQAQTGKICPVIKVAEQLDSSRKQQVDQLVMNNKTRFGNKTMEELNAIAAAKLQAPQQ